MNNRNTSWHNHITYMMALIILSITSSMAAFDNAHFYRATRFFAEPRFEKPRLISVDLDGGFGNTFRAFDGCGRHSVPLNIYGLQNMHQLGVGVMPPLNGDTNLATQILENLAHVPAAPPFGMLSYSGLFSITEFNASYTHNIKRGWFVQAHIPLRTLSLQYVHAFDRTPDTGPFNKQTPEWQSFLQYEDQILSAYDLDIAPFHGTHFGDASLICGWARNYQDTTMLDFIDYTLKTGILLPTGKAKNERNPFSLAWGYNKHWGIPLSIDASVGCYGWLTVGAHADTLLFLKKSQVITMKTTNEQSGFIALSRGCATIHQGPLSILGCYIKADHLGNRFSFLLGYSYAHKHHDTLVPAHTILFNPTIVNTDERYQSWFMHTLHIIAEYDTSIEDRSCNPRVSFFANIPLHGKRIIKTSLGGLAIGIDITY